MIFQRARGALARTRPLRLLLLAAVAGTTLGAAGCSDVFYGDDRRLEIIWPRDGETLFDVETLRARVRGRDVDDYDIYWYVDDSRERLMWTEWDTRNPYKAYHVDTWDWDWRGRGPYTVGFIAEDWRGREIAHRTVRVYVR